MRAPSPALQSAVAGLTGEPNAGLARRCDVDPPIKSADDEGRGVLLWAYRQVRGLFFAVGLSACLLAAPAMAADAAYYRDPTLPKGMPFSSAVVAGDLIFLSGHLGRIPETGALIEGGAGPETTQTLTNMAGSLAAVGAKLSDIVSCTVFLDDLNDFGEMNKAYAAQYPGDKPARATVGADGLALGAAVEIQCIAAKAAD